MHLCRLAVFVVPGLLVAACGGGGGGGAAVGEAPREVDPARPAPDGSASPPVDPTADAASPDGPAVARRDAAADALACAPPDVPTCDKLPGSDAACSMQPGPTYGCQHDIGNGCTKLATSAGWCCPPPAPQFCSTDDPFCVSHGAAACGRTKGCFGPAAGCQHFPDDGIWCCP